MAEKPDFLIIGTMKGGTTALYDFINLHDQVESASKKEIHYFSLYYHLGKEWYLRHFPDAADKLIGEASPTYFDAANTTLIPNLIKSFNPDVKLILIVRDPVERAISHFNHLRRINKIETVASLDINDFFNIPVTNAITENTEEGYYLKQVLSFSCYYRKFRYYRAVFKAEQILVVSNDDLKVHPMETMRRVFEFLRIPPIKRNDFRQLKYSSGTNVSVLDGKTYDHLAQMLYPDYYDFCKLAGIEYSEIEREKEEVKSPPDVHRGKQGWLFLTGGTNRVIDYYKDPTLFSDKLVGAWINLLRSRIDYFSKKNIEYLHLVVPNKLTIYPEYYRGPLQTLCDTPLKKLDRELRESQEDLILQHVINPINYFNRQKTSLKLYWKTDTHWTFYGVFSAYQLLCSRLGISPVSDLIKRDCVKGSLAMDLGSKMTPQLKEEAVFFKLCKNSKRIYANEIVRYKEEHGLENEEGLHVGSHVIYRNETAPYRQRVLLFGTSFSEYRPSLFTGTLAETFYEVSFVWSTSLDKDYIEKYQPDIVLTEIVERFMPEVPVDDFRLEKYVRKKLRNPQRPLKHELGKREINETVPTSSTCKIYDVLPDTIRKHTSIVYQDAIKLLGVTVDKLSKNKLMASYAWQVTGSLGAFDKVFVHFTDKTNQILFQNDHVLCEGVHLEKTLGKYVIEHQVVDIPENVGALDVDVRIGIYAGSGERRLEVTFDDGAIVDFENTRAKVGTVTV